MENKLTVLGSLIGITAMGMAWWLYDWKLALIIFLALFGNNLEQRNRK